MNTNTLEHCRVQFDRKTEEQIKNDWLEKTRVPLLPTGAIHLGIAMPDLIKFPASWDGIRIKFCAISWCATESVQALGGKITKTDDRDDCHPDIGAVTEYIIDANSIDGVDSWADYQHKLGVAVEHARWVDTGAAPAIIQREVDQCQNDCTLWGNPFTNRNSTSALAASACFDQSRTNILGEYWGALRLFN